jgi:hypothetical protein
MRCVRDGVACHSGPDRAAGHAPADGGTDRRSDGSGDRGSEFRCANRGSHLRGSQLRLSQRRSERVRRGRPLGAGDTHRHSDAGKSG